MISPSLVSRLGLCAAFASLLGACVFVSDDGQRHRQDGSSSPSVAPMLVDVDTNQVMTADPGQGVGVFVEYATGGNWHIWWVCDTALTRQVCNFNIAITSPGTLRNVNAAQITSGSVNVVTPSQIEARTQTTTGVDGVTFTTDPGAVITVDASMGGVRSGSFFFFVQDGMINGGLTGTLTNPLQFEGALP